MLWKENHGLANRTNANKNDLILYYNLLRCETVIPSRQLMDIQEINVRGTLISYYKATALWCAKLSNSQETTGRQQHITDIVHHSAGCKLITHRCYAKCGNYAYLYNIVTHWQIPNLSLSSSRIGAWLLNAGFSRKQCTWNLNKVIMGFHLANYFMVKLQGNLLLKTGCLESIQKIILPRDSKNTEESSGTLKTRFPPPQKKSSIN